MTAIGFLFFILGLIGAQATRNPFRNCLSQSIVHCSFVWITVVSFVVFVIGVFKFLWAVMP